MGLNSIFTEEELGLILHALEAQEIKCKTIGSRPISGHGKSTEYEKLQSWMDKAEVYRDLQSKISQESI